MQFSVRTLLAAVAVVGIGAALWVAEPSWWLGAVEALLLIWVPASAVMLTIHSNGRAKAWWLGIAAECIFATCLFLLISSLIANVVDAYAPSAPMRTRFALLQSFVEVLASNFQTLLLIWAFAPVVGLLCVLTHWLFIRSADPAEPKD